MIGIWIISQIAPPTTVNLNSGLSGSGSLVIKYQLVLKTKLTIPKTMADKKPHLFSREHMGIRIKPANVTK